MHRRLDAWWRQPPPPHEFMHSRIDLITPYLSGEWIAAIVAGVDAAKGWARFPAERVVRERGLPLSWLEAESAGLKPSFVHPLAIRVMAERGVDISQPRSRGIDLERLRASDLCVTIRSRPPAAAR